MNYNLVKWIIENKEWLFSGIGITVLLGIGTFLGKIFCKKSKHRKDIKIEQNNEGQNNIQIGIQNNYYGGDKDDR